MDKLLVGSTDIRVSDPDQVRCEDDEVEYMLGALREIFPAMVLNASNIRFRYAGVRPLPYSDAANPGEVSRDHVVHADTVPDTDIPVLSLVVGKWTTFRGFAESVANDVLARLERSRRCETRNEAVGGGRDYPLGEAARVAWIDALAKRHGLSHVRARTLLERYGTKATAVAAHCAARGDGSPDTPLASEPDYTVREIEYLCVHELVTHLSDLLFRRTSIAVSGRLTNDVLLEVAEIAAHAFGWDATRLQQEIDGSRQTAQRAHGVDFSAAANFRKVAT
jgi:glycerol-3-phosphate dehydrogenase